MLISDGLAAINLPSLRGPDGDKGNVPYEFVPL